MSKDSTKHLSNGPSFEERVFARFDAIDARLESLESRQERVESRLDSLESGQERMESRLETLESRHERMESRFETLESKVEQSTLDTKPIWERALAELVEVKGELVEIRKNLAIVGRKLEVLSRDIVEVRAKQLDLEERVEKLEPKPMQ